MNLQVLYYILWAISFLFGITVGITLALSGITRKIMKRINDKTDESYEKIDEDKKLAINAKIQETYLYYKKLQEIRSKNSRLIFTRKKPVKLEDSVDFKRLVIDVAKIFYPESKEPLLELTVSEVFELIRRITARLDDTFTATKLSFVRYLKLSTVYITLGLVNKLNTIKKRKFMQFVLRVVNFSVLLTNIINPASWFRYETKKKITSNLTLFLIENICNIVGKETACVYSKNIRNADNKDIAVIPIAEMVTTDGI